MQANDSTLGTKLLQAIHKETLMQSPLPLQAEASEPLPRGSGQVLVRAEIVDGDRFSHVLGHFEARAEGTTSAKRSSKAVAQKLAERVGYLPEALQAVEAQPDDSVLLRSSPPTMRGPGSDYFEAVAQADGFELKRFTPCPGGGREQKAFCLPDDILSRLSDDAAAILSV